MPMSRCRTLAVFVVLALAVGACGDSAADEPAASVRVPASDETRQTDAAEAESVSISGLVTLVPDNAMVRASGQGRVVRLVQ